MNVGTKSILFGVHAFWWHPFTVALAWRRLYGKWPDRYEWCAILCHDLGYLGKPNMDGPEGRAHPVRGADWAARLAEKVARWSGKTELQQMAKHSEIYHFTIFHSREYSKLNHREPSKLCWADKFCCFYDPPWFYLLRARLSGEIYEFRANSRGAIPNTFSYADWYGWYRDKINVLPEIQSLLAKRRSLYRSCIFPF